MTNTTKTINTTNTITTKDIDMLINSIENTLNTLNNVNMDELQCNLDIFLIPKTIEDCPQLLTTKQWMAAYLAIGEHLFPSLSIEELEHMVDTCHTRELQYVGGPSDEAITLIKKSASLEDLDSHLDMAVALGLEDFGTAKVNLGLDWVLIKNPCEGDWNLSYEEGRWIRDEPVPCHVGTHLVLDSGRQLYVPPTATVLQVQELANALVHYGLTKRVKLIARPEELTLVCDIIVTYGDAWEDCGEEPDQSRDYVSLEGSTVLTMKDIKHIERSWDVNLLDYGFVA